MPEEKISPERTGPGDQDLGETLHSWSFPEFLEHDRTRAWYVGAAVALLALVAYAVLAQRNYLFALILILVAAIVLVQRVHKPLPVSFTIFEDGVRVGGTSYRWRDLREFWILYDPPRVKNLYLTFAARWRPHVVIPLESQNPVEVRHTLVRYLAEDTTREEESFLDQLGKLLKI